MKKAFLVAFLIVTLLALGAMPGALALVEQSEDFFVTDSAGVLSERTRNDIIDANIDLMQKGQGAQIVVVTIPYLDGMFADEYAMRLMNNWGVGNSALDNGMLLLLVTEELKGGIIPGAGISGVWTNAMIDSTLNAHFWPEVDKRNFDTAVRNISQELFSWYASYYNVAQVGGNQAQEVHYYQTYTHTPIFGFIVPFFLIVFVVIIAIVLAAGGDRHRYRAYYMHMGMPIPPYHWWFMLGHRPYRVWYHNHYRWGGPRRHGFGGPHGGLHGRGGPANFGGHSRGLGGSSSFGGRSGRPSGGSSGGFGGFGGGGRSGGFGGGGFRGGGGVGGGFGGRR